MLEVEIQVVKSHEHFQVTCPKCKKCVYSGEWHVSVDDGNKQYFVGEILVCCVKFRCRSVFSSVEAARDRRTTVQITVQIQQSFTDIELIEEPHTIVGNGKVLQ